MRYLRMNGCGNSFVIFDARGAGQLMLSPEQARAVADPATGAGCDQVIAIERSIRGEAFMRIWNASGEEVSACGNATRCVAWLLFEEGAGETVKIETRAGLLRADRSGPRDVTVDMGSPLLKWEEIPVARQTDTVRMAFAHEEAGVRLEGPGGVNMGNPHAVFFGDAFSEALIRSAGPRIEHDPFFPERVNVGFAVAERPDRVRLRVWERGAGLTLACGTGACAAVVAGHRQGVLKRSCEVEVDGGLLLIDWNGQDDRVRMTGPVELEREGVLTPVSAAAE